MPSPLAIKIIILDYGGKALKDLTKEEIGQLFPIEISPYSKNWLDLFENEKKLIMDTLIPTCFHE